MILSISLLLSLPFYTMNTENDKYKPVQLGGKFNHVEMFILCALIAPFSACTLLIFGEQIDQFFQAWERQLIFVMVICTGFGLWWLTWRLKKF